MIRVLLLILALGAIPAAIGGPLAASATGSGGSITGSAYAWGDNSDGQLGEGNTTNSTTPLAVRLPAGVQVTAMAAGASHSLAIGSDGKLYAWGSNNSGQLGNGGRPGGLTPVLVSLPAGVTATAIAAADHHSLAIGSDGNLYAWGGNLSGELGNGSTTQSNVPALVHLPVGVTATAIAAGAQYSLAIGSDGNLYAWGDNYAGQLGNGSSAQSNVPTIVSLPAGVTPMAIAAGFEHSLASGSDGNLYAWGSNNNGQLGTGNTTSSHVPVTVLLPVGVTATAIAAGSSHSLAIGSDGVLYSWGYNYFGQLGDGSRNFPYYNTTLQVVSLPAGVTATAIEAGDIHSLAIGSDGALYAWGDNHYGELGNGTVAIYGNPTPALVSLPTGSTPVALGIGSEAAHSLAILSSAPAVTASQTGTSDGTQANASVGGTGPDTAGSYTATAFGTSGSVTVAQYAGNPVAGTPPPSGANYFDVKVSPGNTFTSVQIVDCNLGTGNTIYWYDGAAWQASTPLSPNVPQAGCDTLTVSSTSSPNLSQLTGTPFAAGGATGPTAARVSAAHASRHAGVLSLTWRMAHSRNVVGFNLYAGTLRLNAHLLPVHRSVSYAFHTHWSGAGPYTLQVLLRDGGMLIVPAR